MMIALPPMNHDNSFACPHAVCFCKRAMASPMRELLGPRDRIETELSRPPPVPSDGYRLI